jgi:hypothetical protein
MHAAAERMQDGSSSSAEAAFEPVALVPVSMPLDGSWIKLHEIIGVGNPFTNNFVWNSGNPVGFQITDWGVVTDAYDIYDFGVLQLSIFGQDWFDLGLDGPFDSPPFTTDPDTAWTRWQFVKGTLQLAAGAHSITIVATQIPTGFIDSTVAIRAHPTPLCDIKPGSYPNPINLKSNGVVPVALLGSAEVNVGDIDLEFLEFQDARPAHDLFDPQVYADHLQDVNQDGYIDLVSHYRAKETDLIPGWPEGIIYSEINGITFVCADDIKTPGKPD